MQRFILGDKAKSEVSPQHWNDWTTAAVGCQVSFCSRLQRFFTCTLRNETATFRCRWETFTCW